MFASAAVSGTGNREPEIARTGAATAQQQPASVPRSIRPAAPGTRPDPADSQPGSELTVYLMTMGYGDQVWERFGHNAIRIVDAARGTDSVYNWGTFDFRQPHFLRRFMTGNTLYWMQGDGMAETLATYRYLNRSVWVQELDLTPDERLAVRDFIAWNALPEHRYYRYDYYLDNCSTRVRDVIDRVIGGQLRASTASRLTSTTYRYHTQRLLQFDRAVALGTMIGLGEVADRPISEWEEMFLPARLQDYVRRVRIRDDDGITRPLVMSEQQLFAAARPPEPAAPPDHTLRNLLIGVAIAGLLVLLARGARGGSRAARAGFTSAATLWAALGGLLGIVLIVGWTATRHVFMARNENLLQFDPLSLVLAVALPFAASRAWAARTARTLSAVVAGVATVGFVMQVLPWFDQTNGAIIALVLPAHLALAWAVRLLVMEPRTSPANAAVRAAAVASRPAA
jgi:hypothetical protein